MGQKEGQLPGRVNARLRSQGGGVSGLDHPHGMSVLTGKMVVTPVLLYLKLFYPRDIQYLGPFSVITERVRLASSG